MRQSRTMLLRQLADQRLFLRISSSVFDSGYPAEAKRLAVTLRVLLHDRPPSSRSLLRQLAVQDVMQYTNTRRDRPEANEVHARGFDLVAVRGTNTAAFYVPLLGSDSARLSRTSSFDDWWTEPVLEDERGRVYSRESIITRVCNKDGGAHVDDLPAWYADLASGIALGQTAGGVPLTGWHFAAVRQVSYELSATLDRELPRLIEGGDQLLTEPVRMPSTFDATPAVVISDIRFRIG